MQEKGGEKPYFIHYRKRHGPTRTQRKLQARAHVRTQTWTQTRTIRYSGTRPNDSCRKGPFPLSPSLPARRFDDSSLRWTAAARLTTMWLRGGSRRRGARSVALGTGGFMMLLVVVLGDEKEKHEEEEDREAVDAVEEKRGRGLALAGGWSAVRRCRRALAVLAATRWSKAPRCKKVWLLDGDAGDDVVGACVGAVRGLLGSCSSGGGRGSFLLCVPEGRELRGFRIKL